MVLITEFEDLELVHWLPVLAALPFCHSLGLFGIWRPAHRGDDDADAIFDHMAMRSGLATSPRLRLLVCWQVTLTALAAERAARGLPRVVMRNPEEELLGVSARPPSARFRQCAVLPSPQIDAVPSFEGV